VNVTPASNRVIVAGGSVTGLYTAMSAAKLGYDVTLVEARGEQASRRTVFNLAPSVADSLARLDDGTGELTGALQTIKRRLSDDTVNDQHKVENMGERVQSEPSRDVDALAMSKGYDGGDPRPWGRVQIAGIENTMRQYMARRFPQIDVRYDTTIDSITQDAKHVTAHLTDATTGAKDAIDGAWLVSATGGRNALGIKRTTFPEVAHFVGGLFEPVSEDRVELRRTYRDGKDLSADTQGLNPAGHGWATVGLPGTGRMELPDTLIWSQISKPAKDASDEELRAVVKDRAKLIGLGDLALRPKDDLLKVDVQLSLLRDHAVQGRVLLAGDELIGPYFPTSTGAGHGLGVSGPLVEQALAALKQPGVDAKRVLDVYDVRARGEAADVMRISRHEMLEDLGIPDPGLEESLRRLDAAKRTDGIEEHAP
jgi:2-polyprenyl-6-methoxyphenol hydroxylase-like FAD-dependent oxidoreductase